MVQLGAYERLSLVLFRSRTPLHVGVGRGGGFVDLPVERDSYGLPYIPSSGIKGAIRERFRGGEQEEILFGSKPESERAVAGCFAPLDAYVVAIPARSLKGLWCLLTCALTLSRLRDFCELTGDGQLKEKIDKLIEKIPADFECLLSGRVMKKFAINGKMVLNEEFVVQPKEFPEIEEMGSILYPEDSGRLTVVPNSPFRLLAERSLMRRARVRLNKETKTVEGGGLWTEEDIPPDTIFVSLFAYSASRGEGKMSAEDVKAAIEKKILPNGKGYLIFGGHETVGRGLVEMRKVGLCKH